MPGRGYGRDPGSGPQGLALIIAAREAGASLIIATGLTKMESEFLPGIWSGCGFGYEKQDVKKEVRSLTGGRMADIVVDVTGRLEAILTLWNWFANRAHSFPAGLTGTGKVTPLALDYITINEIRPLQESLLHTQGRLRMRSKIGAKGGKRGKNYFFPLPTRLHEELTTW